MRPKYETHDWAVLLPLALPPDLPQSFWMNLDENAKVGDEWYLVLSCVVGGCERKFDMWWAKDG